MPNTTGRVLDTFSLTGRTALLTGGSRGLGRAVARALGEAGARVALTATTADAAERAAADLRTSGIDARGYALDVTVRAQVDDVVGQAGADLGTVDLLVNNAGISIGGAALDIDDDVWHRTLATNLDGVWYCSRAVARGLVDAGVPGTIVNIGSMSAQIVNRPRWQPAYLASKAAVHQLTKGLAAEWAPHDIRVNAVAPGYFLTEASPVDQPEYHDDCVAPAAMQRWGTPDELGPVVVFLASRASSFMTGAVVTVDGGYTLF
ncbi:SDR family NAD(P)-dependent oxidoreductase [Oerskovia flava]|uniref:SDR family NAD(P)-dependent oxidoreductase n=1 Tax=Oerskovia flava TaxID=2986422 RepID=UPI00223F180A|nr:SDR family oxidoreductase [Oerskovia sp. JB1-3-2]